MAPAPGTRLGPYEIVAKLGEGGMGEVYRAKDTRLKRDVAVKVLPGAFALDPDRLARFQREAEVLASLNHPNIAHVYGLETLDGTGTPGAPATTFIAMELVEGEELGQRIARGPVPLDEALPIARQMAEALETAHDTGVVHRDLKPGNIMITAGGVVKVLDFGLAKALTPDAGVPGHPSMSPTLTAATQLGVILGTAAYMSPEQARGKAVDKRADIWAFGCVLFELLAGQRAFAGEDISDTLAFVLTKEPAWDALPPGTSPAMTRLLRRCLDKDPKRRLRDIGEARVAIDEALSGQAVEDAAAGRRVREWPWRWITAAAVLAAAIPATWLMKPAPRPDQPMVLLDITPPDGVTFTGGTATAFSPVSLGTLSPDGRYAVFRGVDSRRKATLWLRALDANTSVPIPGTADALAPIWAADSKSLAFYANGRLQKVSLAGGPPQLICGASDLAGGTWNADGVILFAERGKTLQRVSASGGTPSSAIDFDRVRDEITQAGPQFLPDGNHFLYSSGTTKERGEIVLASLDGKTRRVLFRSPNSPAHYAADPAGGGWILFNTGGRLFARPFDANSGELTGEAQVVVDSLASGPTWSASSTGFLAFRRVAPPSRQLTWFARDGTTVGTVGDIGAVEAPRISPDGKTVAFARGEQQNYDVWLFDIAGGSPTRFTFEPGTDSSPLWTPDGSHLLYYSERGGNGFIVERPVNAVGAESILLKGQWPDQRLQLGTISRDGGRVAFSRSAGFNSRIAVVPRPNTAAIAEFDNDTQAHAAISPDGQWMLYTGISAGNREIFAVPASADQRSSTIVSRKQLSVGGGTQPTWRADGKEVFYIADDGKMMAVSVEERESFFRSLPPVALFQTRLTDTALRDYDVTADGQKFLIAHAQETVQAPITVIINWPKLLKK